MSQPMDVEKVTLRSVTIRDLWRIARESNRRLNKVFDERGIEIPFPHRTLYWGHSKDGAQPSLQMAMEARNSTRRED